MQVRLLGRVEARDATGHAVTVPGPKLRGVLALLALDAGQTVSAARLLESVWGEHEDAAPNALHVAVSKLRRVLADAGEADRIDGRPPGYVLDLEPEAVDVTRFETFLRRAADADADPIARREQLERAVGLWGGEPLGGAPDTQAVVALRTRLEELHRTAIEDLLDVRLALDPPEQLIAPLEELVAADPLRERRWALLMRALYAASRQSDALRAYQRARDVLVDQIGVEPGPELRRLHDTVLAQDDAVLDGRPAGGGAVSGSLRRHGNVVHPLGPCTGRAEETARALDELRRHRLVTLTGPGGVGKTRLAMELAVARQPLDPDGVWWADLAPAATAADALRLTVVALGLDPVTGGLPDTLTQLIAVLRDRSATVVLDNCEQLLPALTPAVSDLLAACPAVRVIATSREPLAVPGERVLAIMPLSPSAAVELFRSRTAEPPAQDPATTTAIAAVCERVDRLPLAIELAAARTRHLRVDELLARLDEGLPLGDEPGGPRHPHRRGLRGVAEWSYALLDDRERLVFEHLAVFADGATLDAAVHVCATADVPPDVIEGVLHRLVDKSLVVADRTEPSTRYRMLQTLRDFASEQLAARGTTDAARLAHAQWVRSLAGTMAWGARIEGAAVAAVHAEDVAIRDAIAWAIAAGRPTLALEIVDDLGPYWFGAMRASTGRQLIDHALAATGEVDPGRRASTLAWALVFATLADEPANADRYAAEAETYERAHGDPERRGRLALARALAAGYRTDGDVTRWSTEARRCLEGTGRPIALGHVLFAEGAGLLVTGDRTGAAARLSDAIAVFRAERDHLGLLLAVSRLGELAWRLDDLDLFEAMHRELRGLGSESRSSGVVAGATARLAHARLRRDDPTEARRLATEALTESRDTFMPVVNGYVFRSAGLVDLATGHLDAGRDALETAAAAFATGAGTVGAGQAALCWTDLSRSYRATGEPAAARLAAERAERLAAAAGDPWVLAQVARHRETLDPVD